MLNRRQRGRQRGQGLVEFATWFRRPKRARGQSLAEFALVAPLAIALLAGIIQFGTVFWAQNTLTQIVRDTGRWAATQTNCITDTPLYSTSRA